MLEYREYRMSAFPSTNPCPCGNRETYGDCCGRFHAGDSMPETAEKLMRSRYSAFVVRNGDYLAATLAPEKRADFDADGIRDDQTQWTGLEIIDRAKGGLLDQTGIVEFVASFIENGQAYQLHERSNFVRRDGKWFYVDGVFPSEGQSAAIATQGTSAVAGAKAGRNDPCPCGSGKKFKKCCG
tara:strand:+ start:861 stop:1409 length:549 start_codon:yes stop_codon:yes gene_type:complete